MPTPFIIHTGIFFNAIVSNIVGLTAVALAIFLLRRWKKLSPHMKAYGWFWLMTALVWLPTSYRYFLISMGGSEMAVYVMTIIGQLGVAATGPTLFYYLFKHLKINDVLTISFSVLAGLLGAIALLVDLQPGGIIMQPVTFFSAEIALNIFSISIFFFVTTVIFFLVLRDIAYQYIKYKKQHDQSFIYEALYSVAIAIYLVLGSIEETGTVSGWPVVIFRSLYIATFLYVYIILEKSSSAINNYLVDSETTSS